MIIVKNPHKVLKNPLLNKRTTDATLASKFVGKRNQPFLVMDEETGDVDLRVSDGETPGGRTLRNVRRQATLDTPSIISPDSALAVIPNPVVVSSPFIGYDKYGAVDEHVATLWEFFKDEQGSGLYFTTGWMKTQLTSLDLEAINREFPIGATVYTRVTYRSGSGLLRTSPLSKFTIEI